MSDDGRDADEPTVLLVEDEQPLVETYTEWLDGECDVRTATSGEGTLEALPEAVSVVLLDRMVPGMSGDGALERIRERTDAWVATVTAVERDFDVPELGFEDYLTEPIDRGDLLATVEDLHARGRYVDLERELFSRARKHAVLRAATDESERRDSEGVARLERVRTLRERLEGTLPEVGDCALIALGREVEEVSGS